MFVLMFLILLLPSFVRSVVYIHWFWYNDRSPVRVWCCCCDHRCARTATGLSCFGASRHRRTSANAIHIRSCPPPWTPSTSSHFSCFRYLSQIWTNHFIQCSSPNKKLWWRSEWMQRSRCFLLFDPLHQHVHIGIYQLGLFNLLWIISSGPVYSTSRQ